MITAWSTPGAALLTSALADYPYAEAIGAFVVAGVLMAVVGATGLFGRILDRIPPAIVAAMLAGILFPFALAAFAALSAAPEIVAPVLVAFVLAKRILARYAVLLALLAGVAAASVTGQLDFSGVRLAVAKPLLEVPAWSLSAIVGLALPLFIVTFGSQQAPGMGVLRAAGYKTNDRLLIGSTGLFSALLAPFGSHAINLAAITAAICTGEEAHPDPQRRYVAGLACGARFGTSARRSGASSSVSSPTRSCRGGRPAAPTSDRETELSIKCRRPHPAA